MTTGSCSPEWGQEPVVPVAVHVVRSGEGSKTLLQEFRASARTPRDHAVVKWMQARSTHLRQVQASFSNTIVAWMRSPPPNPLLPEDAVVMVCRR